jgi:hypothetical protein
VQSRRAPAARDGLDETEGSSERRARLRSLATVAGLAIMVFLIVQVGSDEALTAFAYDRVPFLRLIAARIAGEAVNVMTAVVGVDAIKVSPEPGVTTI